MTGDSNASAGPTAPKNGSGAKAVDPLVGTTLDGRFQIEEVLGSGGAGVVYKAKQLRVNRYVAIKTIRVQVDNSAVIRERFEREINSLCSLNHPNIVTVYDCIFGWNDQPYVVMDYLKGLSLDALLRKDGAFELDRFARIALQVLSALEHAHKKGIVHRDLKPGNIVLLDDETDIVKVVDFGLAKLTHDRSLTKSGELWGSPPYMSPEQAQGEPADSRSDVYSLGAVLYEMLTGKDPFFDVVTVYELIQAHVFKNPPAFEDSNPSAVVPPGVQKVIFKCLEKNPEDRYQSVGQLQSELIDALSGHLEGESRDSLIRFATRSISKEPVVTTTTSSDSHRPVTTSKIQPAAMASRFRRQLTVEQGLRWIPWTIAVCSFLLALSLGVIVLKLLSREEQSAVVSDRTSSQTIAAPTRAPQATPSKPVGSEEINAVAKPANSPVPPHTVPRPQIAKITPHAEQKAKPRKSPVHAHPAAPVKPKPNAAKHDPWDDLLALPKHNN